MAGLDVLRSQVRHPRGTLCPQTHSFDRIFENLDSIVNLSRGSDFMAKFDFQLFFFFLEKNTWGHSLPVPIVTIPGVVWGPSSVYTPEPPRSVLSPCS